MAANLTPQYLRSEEAYRRATTPEEELRCLQDMLREVPKHKGTDRLQAELKQKISKARKEVETLRSQPARRGTNIRLPRQGAGRVILLGGPNAGKSRLLASLTRATPQVTPYPFATREPLPGMMTWEDISVQLIDTPPITLELLEPSTQALIRNSDFALLLIDLGSDEGVEQAVQVIQRLEATKTRLGPNSFLDQQDLGRSYTRTYLVYNKMDLPDADLRREWVRESALAELTPLPDEAGISAERSDGLEQLRERIVQSLDIVRVYTKHPNEKEADYSSPHTIRRGGTLIEVAAMIHHDLAARLKYGKVWTPSRPHPMTVTSDYVVCDRDVVELHS